MYYKQIVLITAILFGMSFSSLAQKNVIEDTITVEGVCAMCKQRIEEAAFGKGVKFAEWSNTTSLLAIAYKSDKTSLEEIEERIAKAGHTTENKVAVRDDYESLPECCRYEHLHKH